MDRIPGIKTGIYYIGDVLKLILIKLRIFIILGNHFYKSQIR